MSVATCRLDKLVKPRVHDRLVVSPASLLDSAHATSTDTVTATLRLASADGATLSWTATATAPWLTLLPGSGAAPDTLVVQLRGDTLSQVMHHDTIAFTSLETPGDTIKVPVAFTILAPEPRLTVSPLIRADSAFAGSAQPRTFVVRIGNTGELLLTWSASVDSPWLSLSTDSGGVSPQGSDSTIVSLKPGALGPGMQSGTVTIAAAAAIGSPKTVTVDFKIKPCAEPTVTADAVVNASLARSDCGAPDRAGSFAKRYSVVANGGDTLSFRLTSASFDAYLTLHDSLGTLLSQNDDCPGSTGPACILEFRPPAAGRYVIEATTVGAADTGAFSVSVVRELAPSLPQSIGQFRGDSTTTMAIGATTPDSATVFKATLDDPNPRDSVRLEVELVDVSTLSTVSRQSGYVAVGQTAWIRVTGLTENAGYSWRGRACDKTSRCSVWQSFGANSAAAADFFVNKVPENPTIDALSLNQFNGANMIPIGGGTGGSGTVTFKAILMDVDPGDALVLEVESKTTSAAFDGATTLYRGTGVASGSTAAAAAAYSAPLLGANNYHWRARACDQTSRCSAWVSFGGNSDAPAATDFHVP
jgi:hypothetical protein